jgi:hypothetical protein
MAQTCLANSGDCAPGSAATLKGGVRLICCLHEGSRRLCPASECSLGPRARHRPFNVKQRSPPLLKAQPLPAEEPLPPTQLQPLPYDRSMLDSLEQGLGRRAVLRTDQLERGIAASGDVTLLRAKLTRGEPVTMVAIGASNTVRGGCHSWQQPGSKCTDARYTNRSSGGSTANGWLLQAFDAMNRTWPHAGHKLLNHALMATGPQSFVRCLDTFVPTSADIVIIAFNEMCW